ncbi:MAG: nuclear transport factor 2 family protein [Acidimicrobiales bacterium]
MTNGVPMSSWFEQYLGAWESGDVENVTAWVTDDVAFEDVGAGHKVEGKNAMATFVAASFAAVPGARFDFVGGADLGDSYYMEWVMRPMGIRGVSVGTRRNGKIAANRDYWNGKLLNLP